MNLSTNLPTSHTQAAFYSAPMDVLDSCHQEILAMLADLRLLLDDLDAGGVDDQSRELARSIHLFFSTTGVPHHLDEETHIFPRLQALADAGTVEVIDHLRQDHLKIEAQWRGLVPQLDMIARGYRQVKLNDFRRLATAFASLCENHITLEESLIYPKVRAGLGSQDLNAMRREMASRRVNLNAIGAEPGTENEDGDIST